MKKLFALLLVGLVLLSLCACGGNNEPATTEAPATEAPTEAPTEATTEAPTEATVLPETDWEIAHYVDDFGDETKNSYIRSRVFSGTFSNTATNNGALSVILFYEPYYLDSSMITLNSKGEISSINARAFNIMSFRLLEYGNLNATYSSYDDITLKMKIGDDTYSTELYGDAPNGDLYCYYLFNNEDTGYMMDKMVGAFYNDEDVKCIIEIGSSKYNFTLQGKGFREADRELQVLCGIVPKI